MTNTDRPSCCTPTGGATPSAPRDTASIVPGEAASRDIADSVVIPAGTFLYGCDRREGHPADGEGPVRHVHLDAFRIDRHAVSVARFARFVEATGYVTDAERIGWSFVFAGLLPDDFEETRGVAAAPWWRQVFGASWRNPEGPLSGYDGRENHPVVHISHNDALSFCAWAGKRLPTEAEWEKAARGGREGQRFPWGDEETPGGVHHCNVWQGTFPSDNAKADGFYGTAPVDAFAPNGYGLHNMAGNAWEWCADWFTSRRRIVASGDDPARNPHGPEDGTMRVMRGGSYLCHPSYCWRYRNGARSNASPDTSTGHIGFRCVAAV